MSAHIQLVYLTLVVVFPVVVFIMVTVVVMVMVTVSDSEHKDSLLVQQMLYLSSVEAMFMNTVTVRMTTAVYLTCTVMTVARHVQQ